MAAALPCSRCIGVLGLMVDRKPAAVLPPVLACWCCRAARPRVRLNKPQAAALRSWIAGYYTGGSSSGKCSNGSTQAEEAQVLLNGIDGVHSSGTPKKRSSAVSLGAGGEGAAS